MPDPGDILRDLIAAAAVLDRPLPATERGLSLHRTVQAKARLNALAKHLGPLRDMAEAVREGLDALILDEDLTDAKLRDAAERLLPRLADKARAAELALDAALLERARDG